MFCNPRGLAINWRRLLTDIPMCKCSMGMHTSVWVSTSHCPGVYAWTRLSCGRVVDPGTSTGPCTGLGSSSLLIKCQPNQGMLMPFLFGTCTILTFLAHRNLHVEKAACWRLLQWKSISANKITTWGQLAENKTYWQDLLHCCALPAQIYENW